ncbi:ATP-dependent helicase, partial [Desulfobulbus alkaliphilus]|uniref:ATP-dependent helicase n=1 Tax=Desulfobulbus alkaliphilus TaxID=869814 RepID=UPI0019642369
VMGGTFHATANILLRRHGHHLGLTANFTIIDRADAEGIVNLIKSSLGMAGAGKRFPSKRVIVNLLSGTVNKSASIEELVYREHIHLTEFIEDFYKIREHYQQFKRDHGLLDYDDLLLRWQQLLQQSDQAREELSDRFRYILVDEYQDTNRLQAEIVQLLAYRHSNVMAVGDDAQSIYSFRGADFTNILRFAEHFPGTKIVKLEENYRSTQPILELTNAIIARAEKKFTKTLFTSAVGHIRPRMVVATNETAEARFIVDQIKQRQQDDLPLHEMAVLFRSGYHSYKLEIELASHGIDFDKRGGLKLTESAHIKDLLSFFRVLINPWDHLSWNRILLQLDKVGPKTVQKILHSIRDSDTPLTKLTTYQPGPAWKSQFEQLTDTLLRLNDPVLTPSQQYDLAMAYYEPVFEKMYYDDYPKRRKDLDQIKALIAGYGDLQSFVDDTALDPPESTAAQAASSGSRLILSTIHSAKGLEWDTVFVMGLAEGRFPHQNVMPGEQWEEERRLLYVAATRAKQQLFLTYPRELVTPERQHRRVTMSPFLQEISPGLYNSIGNAGATAVPKTHNPFRKEPSDRCQKVARVQSARTVYREGMRVSHAIFGVGRVTSIPGPRRVEILFDRHGGKILHLDYARLEPLE